MALFGGKSKGTSSGGSDNGNSTTVKGSQDRPYDAWRGIDSSQGDLGDGGVCHSPSNKIEEQD